MLDLHQDQIVCVFVVDDEAMIAETVAMILRIEGYDASFFVNPFDAFRAAQGAVPICSSRTS